MARMNRELAKSVRDLLEARRFSETAYRLPRGITAENLYVLVSEALGEDFFYYPNADELVWDVARHQGYVIPSCPVESRGDAREFLQEYGVSNAHDWYLARGLADADGAGYYGRSVLMVRNESFWRRIIEVPAVDDSRPDKIVSALIDALDFALGNDTGEDDITLFRC
jgi:hypothetical protein